MIITTNSYASGRFAEHSKTVEMAAQNNSATDAF